MNMKKEILKNYFLESEVRDAIENRLPVVALESTVITHGLPYPDNLSLALEMEAEVRKLGALPATIALLDGKVQIGLTQAELEQLAQGKGFHKISSRDIGPAIALGWSGGTTVAGTMAIASRAGILVFATGGIGGVHRQADGHDTRATWDVSADLPQLANTPMMVVCAGAKAILDLPATIEYLETWGVPVIGYQCDEFPAFYARQSGLMTSAKADRVLDVVKIAKAHWESGLTSALLIVNPPPEEHALSLEQVESAVNQAVEEAARNGIHGQQVTPYLLQRMTEITHGSSLKANLDLLTNNARLAALIAQEYFKQL